MLRDPHYCQNAQHFVAKFSRGRKFVHRAILTKAQYSLEPVCNMLAELGLHPILADVLEYGARNIKRSVLQAVRSLLSNRGERPFTMTLSTIFP